MATSFCVVLQPSGTHLHTLPNGGQSLLNVAHSYGVRTLKQVQPAIMPLLPRELRRLQTIWGCALVVGAAPNGTQRYMLVGTHSDDQLIKARYALTCALRGHSHPAYTRAAACEQATMEQGHYAERSNPYAVDVTPNWES